MTATLPNPLTCFGNGSSRELVAFETPSISPVPGRIDVLEKEAS